MKGVFIRVGGSISVSNAIAHLESLGYENRWKEGIALRGVSVLIGECTGRIGWASVNENIEGYNLQEIFIPATKHKHFDLIVKWLGDPLQGVWAKIDDKWVEIDVATLVRDAIGHHVEIRVQHEPPKRKIMIGDAEIDAPERDFPERGAVAFIAAPDRSKFYIEEVWEDFAHLRQHKWRGLVHLNKEAAIAHAKALIKLSGGCVDE